MKKNIIIKFIKYILKGVYRRSFWFIAPMTRCLFGIADLVNPLFYSSNLRIKEQIDGGLKFKSEKTAIFVLYQNDRIPFYVQNVLDIVQKLEVNCVLSINDNFSRDNIEKLQKQCSQLFIRRNFGADFTAYKDVVSLLDLKRQERLIIMNDTLFYFKKDIEKLFGQLLDDKYDIVAFSRNSFEIAPHLQSFLLSLSNRVITDKDFSSYWANYKPFNDKTYIINNGEVAFSTKALNKYCDSTKVIYNLDFLVACLKKLPLQIRSAFTIKPTTSLAKINYIKFDDKILDSEKIFRHLQETNVTHSASFLIANCGIGTPIKRDIVYRHILSLEQVQQNLEMLKVDKGEIKQALQELKARGEYSQVKFSRRFLCSVGVR
jgi:hypothetical protein